MSALTPDLEFQKLRLRKLSNDIQQIANENYRNGIFDKLDSHQLQKFNSAGNTVIDAFLLGAFNDPQVGKRIGMFAACNVTTFIVRRSDPNLHRLIHELRQYFWYPKRLDVAPRYETDGRTITKAGAVERWYQETMDSSNLIEFLSITIGSEANESAAEQIEFLKTLKPLKDFPVPKVFLVL